jgi:hypothetical protein
VRQGRDEGGLEGAAQQLGVTCCRWLRQQWAGGDLRSGSAMQQGASALGDSTTLFSQGGQQQELALGRRPACGSHRGSTFLVPCDPAVSPVTISASLTASRAGLLVSGGRDCADESLIISGIWCCRPVSVSMPQQLSLLSLCHSLLWPSAACRYCISTTGARQLSKLTTPPIDMTC